MDNLTIFTDASFCPQTKAAGGAFWSREATEKYSASFPIFKAMESHEAELLAALTAMCETVTHEPYEPLMAQPFRMILVVDCLYVKQVLDGHLTPKSDYLNNRVIEAMNRTIEKNVAQLKINHVKAHSGTGEPRKWVNNWCDIQAKKHMIEQRSYLLTQQGGQS